MFYEPSVSGSTKPVTEESSHSRTFWVGPLICITMCISYRYIQLACNTHPHPSTRKHPHARRERQCVTCTCIELRLDMQPRRVYTHKDAVRTRSTSTYTSHHTTPSMDCSAVRRRTLYLQGASHVTGQLSRICSPKDGCWQLRCKV